MPAERGRSDVIRTYVLAAVDALAYAGVVLAGTVLFALVVGIATGGGVRRAKLLLFLAGWLLVGIATLRLWPKSPRQVALDDEAGHRRRAATPAGDTRIEAVADAVPPLRWMARPGRRLAPATKLFVAGLLVLAASFLLEVVFAVE